MVAFSRETLKKSDV